MDPIRALLVDPCEKLLGEQCTRELLFNLNYKNVDCLKLALSKILSLGIIGGAMVVKLPQIIKILSSHSTEGISFLSYFLDTMAMAIGFGYSYRFGYPFTSYGETLFVTIQNLIVLFALGVLRREMASYSLLFLLFGVFFASLIMPDYMSDTTLMSMQVVTIPLSMLSRLPQIWSIWRRRHTGQLSFLTTFANAAGCVARVFTTYQEVQGDVMVLMSSLLAAFLNVTILFQMLYYWNNAPTSAITPRRRSSPRVSPRKFKKN